MTLDDKLSMEHDGPLKHDGWAPAAPDWDDLCTEEKLIELRRGEESPFHPQFVDDPTTWADCDRDGRVVVLAEGICMHCGRLVHEARGLA